MKVTEFVSRRVTAFSALRNGAMKCTHVTTNSERRLFVHATNVHTGGGRSLLLALLESLPRDLRVVALLDLRMAAPEKSRTNVEVKFVKPSLWQRFKAECWLARNLKHNDVVLCFGNLPPLFPVQGRAVVFIQNRYLIDPVSLSSFPLKTRLRLQLERFWFLGMAGHAQAFVVQTPSMRSILESLSPVAGKPVHVLPFVNTCDGYHRAWLQSGHKAPANDFIYVATGEPHKNHRRLIEAWCLLAQDGIFPSLWLTLDVTKHADLCQWLELQKTHLALRIENLGVQPHDEIRRLYTQVKALIYPSTFESFGLPLIEARQAGLAVLASELDFVRDVLDPEQVFDPQSPLSIARAVKRFMGFDEAALPLLNASEFLKSIWEKCE
jgi:glycosyltransferase involved in cell wall biosynthesis